MTMLISKTTGEQTSRFGFRGTDLGYFTLTNHGYVIATFGDTFDSDKPGGSGWRSPVMLRSSNKNLEAGIRWDNAVGGGRAKEVISYTHHSAATARTVKDAAFTHIPNDMIHMPDGRFLLSTFSVRDWENSTPGGSWNTWANCLWVSNEQHAENWDRAMWSDLRAPIQFNNDPAQGWDKFQNATLVLRDGYLYMFGTQAGRWKGGGVYLARVRADKWETLAAWEFWSWTGSMWAWKPWMESKPGMILSSRHPGGAIGEINVREIEGVLVLSYIDYSIAGGALVTRTAMAPDKVWTAPQIHAGQAQIPALYAPALHPYSTLAKPFAHVSQWHSSAYQSSLYQLDPIARPA